MRNGNIYRNKKIVNHVDNPLIGLRNSLKWKSWYWYCYWDW